MACKPITFNLLLQFFFPEITSVKLTGWLGLYSLSEGTFYRFQRLYLFPVVKDWWGWLRDELIKEFAGAGALRQISPETTNAQWVI